mgnify:CR=1 FL=1
MVGDGLVILVVPFVTRLRVRDICFLPAMWRNVCGDPLGSCWVLIDAPVVIGSTMRGAMLFFLGERNFIRGAWQLPAGLSGWLEIEPLLRRK